MGFQFIKEKVHFLNMIRTEKILKYFFSVEYFFKDFSYIIKRHLN